MQPESASLRPKLNQPFYKSHEVELNRRFYVQKLELTRCTTLTASSKLLGF